jgi:23S rRNA (adenine2503-C2)-methyltransferase
MNNFYDLTLKELETLIGALGKEKYRSRQLFKWIYNKGIVDFDEMSDVPKGLRIIFKDMFELKHLELKEVLTSTDGCIKFGFLGEDNNIIESVLIPEKERNTLCISSQIGCRMGCKFCVTGKIGFIRNLKASEIVGQLIGAKHYLNERKITNIVFMGMGEPIDNLDNFSRALEILKDPIGLDFSHRKITLSSVGLIGGLKTIEPKAAGIAISLNAADDKTRTYLMPINRLYPIREIIDYVKGFKGGNRNRITFEYILIKDINDSPENAKLLSEVLAEVRCKINLIPYNESPYIDFKAPTDKTIEQFHAYLLNKHFTVIVRDSRGKDIAGACGQLGMKYLQEKTEKQGREWD